MRKIKSALAVAAVAAGMLASSLAAAGTANASTYTISYINRCAELTNGRMCLIAFNWGPTPPTANPRYGSTALYSASRTPGA